MIDWLSILKLCAENMKNKVRPLLGSVEAGMGHYRGAGGDITKHIDKVAEDALFQTLKRTDVSCTVISEESGTTELGLHPSQFYVVTDPVDGTTNAVRGLPFLDISLAVSKAPVLESVEVALVTDVLRDITYTAENGRGAFRNGERIKPSEIVELGEALIGVDFNTLGSRLVADKLLAVLAKTRHLRHLGANALEICYVADGTSDAFIDIRGKLRVTDIAAAQLILKEAGGIITAPTGKQLIARLDPTQRVSFIAAANKSIYEEILRQIAQSKKHRREPQ
jgi:myo-inositol-1(or 4)-monophosphatase